MVLRELRQGGMLLGAGNSSICFLRLGIASSSLCCISYITYLSYHTYHAHAIVHAHTHIHIRATQRRREKTKAQAVLDCIYD